MIDVIGGYVDNEASDDVIILSDYFNRAALTNSSV